MMLGDRVIAVDGNAVTNQADMVARLANAGGSVAIDVDRKGRIVRLDMAAAQP
jgi:predicted metalloprotease with PDZ domain